jgi:hypothetical protein
MREREIERNQLQSSPKTKPDQQRQSNASPKRISPVKSPVKVTILQKGALSILRGSADISFHPGALEPRTRKRHLFLRKKIPEQAEKKPRTPSKNETLLFLLLLGEVSEKLVALLLDPLLSPLAGSLGLGTLGIHLLLEDALTGLLGLGLVDLDSLSALVPR